MPLRWRLLLVIYNLFLLVAAGVALAIAAGRSELIAFVSSAMATSQNRFIAGIVGVCLVILALSLLYCLGRRGQSDSIDIEDGFLGNISMSVAAVKVMIMKSVRQVEGIKEVRPIISRSGSGISVKLHMMVNPELNIPELVKSTQEKVKAYLEDIGGLQVAEVRVLVDDFNTSK